MRKKIYATPKFDVRDFDAWYKRYTLLINRGYSYIPGVGRFVRLLSK